MNSTVKARPLLKTLPMRMHHHAYTTRDHEMTRNFYEDILGIPLIASFVERENLFDEWIELAHAFYGLQDGSALAFFNFADPSKQIAFDAKEQSPFIHIALSVEKSTQDELVARTAEAGLATLFIDHGYCKSLYVRDPNGLNIEFTVDPPDVKSMFTAMGRSAHADLARWIAGSRETNNAWRS